MYTWHHPEDKKKAEEFFSLKWLSRFFIRHDKKQKKNEKKKSWVDIRPSPSKLQKEQHLSDEEETRRTWRFWNVKLLHLAMRKKLPQYKKKKCLHVTGNHHDREKMIRTLDFISLFYFRPYFYFFLDREREREKLGSRGNHFDNTRVPFFHFPLPPPFFSPACYWTINVNGGRW